MNLISTTNSRSSNVLKAKQTKSLQKFVGMFFMLIAMLTFGTSNAGAQSTVLINPATDGGFSLGSSFADNGWTVSNSSNNPWTIGTGVTSTSFVGNSVYPSSTGGANANYDNTAPCANYFWKDVTVPAGQTNIILTFKWIGLGESSYDIFQVFTAPTTITPVGSTTFPGAGTSIVPASIAGATFVVNSAAGTSGEQTVTVNLPVTLAGTTFRLIFLWKSDNSFGTPPATAIDNISLTSAAPLMFSAVASGNFGTAATWNRNAVPSSLDSIRIESGLTVTADAASTTVAYAELNGTLTYATAATTFSTTGDLIVNSTGILNAFTTTAGKTLNVGGNLTNNGTMNLSVTGSTLVLNRAPVITVNSALNGITAGSTTVTLSASNSLISVGQFVGGTGIPPLTTVAAINGTTLTLSQAATQTVLTNTAIAFGTAQTAGGTGTFTNNVIQNLTFNNTTPNNIINWNFNNSVVGTTLTFTNGRVALGATNSMTVGTSTTSTGTLTISNSNLSAGFTSGKYIKWYANGTNGPAISEGTLPAVAGDTRMPFVTLSGDTRHAVWSRATGTTTTGRLSCLYTDANTTSTVSVNDLTSVVTLQTPSVAGSITTGSTSVTLAAANSFIQVGQTVVGTGIAAGTTVAAISGTSLTLSQAATATSTTTAVSLSFFTPYNVNRKYDATWAFSTEGSGMTATNMSLLIYGYNAFNMVNGNTRLINATGNISGTASAHQRGTATPTLTARRTGIATIADLTASPISLALASTDLPIQSATTGDWNTPSTWVNNTVPTCTDAVIINPNHTITSSTTNNAANITIFGTGALTVSGGSLTVGCGTNNQFVNNSGTLTVSGGAFNVNGNINNLSGSIFNQTAGDIVVDGNGGTIANSVATGTPLVWFQGGGSTFSQTAILTANSNIVTLTAANPNIRVGLVVNSTSSFVAGTVVTAINGLNVTMSTPALTSSTSSSLTFVLFRSVNLTGGRLVIVDGHIGTATADRALTYAPTSFPYPNVTTNHTIQFGDGISTTLASTKGFELSTATRFAFGNIVVNTTSMYPYTTQNTTPAGIASGATSLTLSAANTSIFVGQGVAGNGIAAGTTVSAISGTTLTLSQATTGTFSGAQTLSFLAPAFVAPSTANTVIFGNLTVTNGEFRTPTGITTIVGGDIVNNGILTTIGTINMGEVTVANLASPTITQNANGRSISGTGVFRNLIPTTTALSTANFTSLTINNSSANGVSFASANALLSGNNTGTVSGTLTFNGNINTNGGTLALGIAGTTAAPTTPVAGTLTITSGGITVGGKMRRFVTNTTIGTSSANMFALVSANGLPRHVALAVSGTAGTLAPGWLEASHADTAGLISANIVEAGFVDSAAVMTAGSTAVTLFTPDARILVGQTVTGPGIAPGTTVAAYSGGSSLTLSQAATASTTVNVPLTFAAFTSDLRSRANWSVSAGGGYSAGTYRLIAGFNTTGLFQSTTLSRTSPRVVQLGSTVGVHAIATGSGSNPVANRANLTLAELIGSAHYVAGGTQDIPWISVSSGDWNAASTWNKNAVPTCANSVIIDNGHTVTVNSGNNFAKDLVINPTGTLVSTSGSLQIGCTFNNNFVTNNGTYTMNGGTLTINGSMLHNGTSIFTQTAGDIIIDGNDSGFVSRSVPTAVNILQLNSDRVFLTGGRILITDPHAANGSTDFAFIYNVNTGTIANNLRIGVNHTIQFGDSLSTNPGGNVRGFFVTTAFGSRQLAFGKLVLNTAPGLNRNALTFSSSTNSATLSDVTIRKGNFVVPSLFRIAGNLVNNDTLSAVGTLAFSRYVNTIDSFVTIPQSIGGTGVFRNLNSTVNTANLTSLGIVNSNPSGLTINVPLTISGSLQLLGGIINTTNTNLITVGTATLSGSITGFPVGVTTFVNGPLARTFPASRTATGGTSTATLFPVGKGGVYLPIYMDPTTTPSGSVIIRAEAFNTNAGTPGPGVIASTLSPTRWETAVIAGLPNFTSTHVALTGTTTMTVNNKILQAATGDGAYGAILPGTAFTAGTPNVLTTTGSQILAADFLGNFAYADLVVCTTPTTQPSNLVFTQKGANSVRGTFSVVTGASHYLVVAYPKGSAPTAPVNFRPYTTNATLGAGRVISALVNPTNTFYMSGLTPSTTYDVYVYTYNNTGCYGPVYNTSTPLFDTIRTAATPTNAPTALAASLITNTGYTLSWTADSISTFELDLSTSSDFSTFVPGYNGKVLPISTRSETITGLNGSTTYFARLRAINGGIYSLNSATLSTLTDCNPIQASALPWTEGFEGLATGTNIFPNCWKFQNTASTWTIGTDARTGIRALQRTWSTNGWAFTPRFSLTAGTAYDFSFWVKTVDATLGYDIFVGAGTTADPAAMTDTLYNVLQYQGPTYVRRVFTFIPTVSGDYTFGTRVIAPVAPNGIRFDDFRLAQTPLKAYDSSKVVVAPTSSVTPGTTTAVVAKLRVFVSGSAPTQPLNATSLTVGTTGTTNRNDISNLKVYFSGTNPNFNNTATQFGSTVATPTANNIVAGTASLEPGDNYFWVTYDIKSTATVGNFVDATIRSITANTVAYTPLDTAAAGNRLIEAPMTYVSSTVTQTVVNSIEQNGKNEQILGLRVVTSPTGGAIKLNSIDVSTTGTSLLSDVKNIKVFYTGNNASFATTTQVGTTVTSVAGTNTIVDDVFLTNNTNYFWITYDLDSLATLGNLVDAEVPSIVVDGTPRIPTVTAPAGSRTIRAQYCPSTATNTADDDIGNFTISRNGVDVLNNGIATPALNNSTSNKLYSDFTKTLPATNLLKSGVYNFSISQINSASYYSTGRAIYIDYNDDGDFADAGETVFRTTATVGTVNTPSVGQFTVPCDAKNGLTRLRVVMIETTASPAACGTYTWGETEDYLVNIVPTQRSFVSSNTQQDSSLISAGSTDEKIIGIPVVSTGCGDSLIASSFTFGIGSSTSASDILTAKVYYTNGLNRYNTDSLFGSVAVTGNTFTITGNKRISSDTSWFWLAYDLSATAAVGNRIDASLTNHIINGATNSPAIASPFGFRTIAPPATYISSTSYAQRTGDVYQGTKRNVMLSGVIRMSSGSPVVLSSMEFSTNGSTSPVSDVDSAEVFFTTDSITLNPTPANRYGTATLNPSGNFVVSGNRLLRQGANYFWLVYSIPATATVNNLLDAEFISANVAGVSRIPVVTAPAGARKIKAPYCASTATDPDDEDIGGVIFSTIATGTNFTPASNPLSVNLYTDFTTSVPAAPVQRRVPTPLTVYVINSAASTYTTSVNVFIDYNQNSVFDLPQERVAKTVLTTLASGGSRNFTTNINIPMSAMLGETRMRIVCIETSTVDLNPCGTYTWGETEDYTINILPQPAGDYYNPVISNVVSNPVGNSCTSVPHVITANVFDSSGVYPPVIRWTLAGAVQSPIVMSRSTGNTFIGTIPATINQQVRYDIFAIDSSVNVNFDSSTVNSYIDQYLNVFAGEDQLGNIGSGSVLTASSNLLNSIRITEINLFGGSGTGGGQPAWPSFLNTTTLRDDNVEFTNLGSVPIDLSGHRYERWTSQTASTNFTFPSGTIVLPDSVLIMRMGTGTPLPARNYFVDGGFTTSSGAALGIVLKDPSGAILDAVAYNAYTFPAISGVTAADWSGAGAVSQSTHAGSSLNGPDLNNNTTWLTSGSLTTSMGYKNTNVVSVVTPTVTWTGGTIPTTQAGSRITTPPHPAFGVYTYVASLTDGICTTTDTVKVTAITPYVINLGADAFICPGSSMTLDAGALTNARYLWSTGDTTQTITVSTPGTYHVTATSALYGKIAKDTIVCTAGSFPAKPFGVDTSFCLSSGITLDAGNPGSTYLWSTGATTRTINTKAIGQVSVTITSASGCVTRDTINLSLKPAPVVTLGPDTKICPGGSTVLDAGNAGASFLWNTGATTQTITASAAGTYVVTVNNGSCSTSDTIVVTLHSAPVVNLGNDLNICTSDTVTLDAGNAGSTYLWSTGATTRTIRVSNAGTYSVVVTNTNGCSSNDAVVVTNKPTPVSTFSVTVANGQSVTFQATTTAGLQFSWNFGDPTSAANTSQFASPTHVFTSPGNYEVTLTVTSVATGCRSTTKQIITVTGLGNDFAEVFKLGAAPNPFAGNTTISYVLPESANSVTMEVYDMIGRQVASIFTDEYQAAGTYKFDYKNEDLQTASGVYMVRLTVDGKVAYIRIVDVAKK